jgi:hypothetical protein
MGSSCSTLRRSWLPTPLVGPRLSRAAPRAAGVKARINLAEARARDLAATIAELRAAGATSLQAIAGGLNARKVPTARGAGLWTRTQVSRVLARLN